MNPAMLNVFRVWNPDDLKASCTHLHKISLIIDLVVENLNRIVMKNKQRLICNPFCLCTLSKERRIRSALVLISARLLLTERESTLVCLVCRMRCFKIQNHNVYQVNWVR